MYLSPADEERLRVFGAAELARKTLARGLQLNVPEAVALACDEMHMAARAGASFDDVAAAGRRAVRPGQLLPGVGDLIDEICLEVLLGDGTRLVVLRQPWQGRAGDAGGPGAVRVQDGDIEMHEGLEHRQLPRISRSGGSIRGWSSTGTPLTAAGSRCRPGTRFAGPRVRPRKWS
jgi:urease subunit gamma/beta